MSEPAANPVPPAPQVPDPLAVALSKLDPAPHGFDRDALMFAAGGASKLWLVSFWRAIAVLGFLTAGVFATLYFTRPTHVEVMPWKVGVEPKR